MNLADLLIHKKLTRLLGFSIDGNSIDVIDLSLQDQKVKIEKSFRFEISGGFLDIDPENLARKLKEQLEREQIKTHDALMCLPLKWLFSSRIELPDISEEETCQYIQLRIEREFPTSPNELSYNVLKYEKQTEGNYAIICGIDLKRSEKINRIFQLAGLNLVSLTSAVPALRFSSLKNDSIAIQLLSDSLEMGVFKNSFPSALRSIDCSINQDSTADSGINSIGRELRVTLGQGRQPQQKQHSTAYIFGNKNTVSQLLASQEPFFKKLGIEPVIGNNILNTYVSKESLSKVTAPITAFATAKFLKEGSDDFELLPPKVSQLEKVINQLSTRSFSYAGSAIGIILLVMLILFSWQYFTLTSLEKNWKTIQVNVESTKVIQENIRTYRSWHNSTPQTLNIIQSISSAFPEDGKVWLQSIEIEELRIVTCKGSARSNKNLLNMLEKLRNTAGVENLSTSRVEGTDTLKFTIQLNWNEGEYRGSL